MLSLPGLSQEETVQPISEYSGKVIIRGAPAPTPAPAPTEPVAPAPVPNEDAEIMELEAGRQERLKKIQGIEAVTKPLAEPILSPLEEIQKLGHKQIGAAALMDDKVLAIIQKTFKEGLMSKLPEEDVRAMILLKVKGSYLEGFFKSFPKFLNLSVNLMRDKDALAGLLGILIRREDLKTYGYICLALFIFGLFVKSRIIKPKWPFLKRFRYSVIVSLFLTSISFYLFYSFFGEEIGPTLSVISRSF